MGDVQLQSMLGASLNEDAAQRVVHTTQRPTHPAAQSPLSDVREDPSEGTNATTPSLKHRRSMSYPPPSPTTPRLSSKQSLYDLNYTSSSALERERLPSGSPSPGAASPETPYSPRTPYDGEADIWGRDLAEHDPVKEARRRRVRKLQAMLGEHVSLETIVQYEQQAAAKGTETTEAEAGTGPKHGRQPSKLGQAFARMRLGKRERRADSLSSSGQSDEEEWVVAEPPQDFTLPKDSPFTARDKKLMALFGTLP